MNNAPQHLLCTKLHLQVPLLAIGVLMQGLPQLIFYIKSEHKDDCYVIRLNRCKIKFWKVAFWNFFSNFGRLNDIQNSILHLLSPKPTVHHHAETQSSRLTIRNIMKIDQMHKSMTESDSFFTDRITFFK